MRILYIWVSSDYLIQVDVLKVELDIQEIELSKKNAKAEELIKIVKNETEKVKFEKDKGICNITKQYIISVYVIILNL